MDKAQEMAELETSEDRDALGWCVVNGGVDRTMQGGKE